MLGPFSTIAACAMKTFTNNAIKTAWFAKCIFKISLKVTRCSPGFMVKHGSLKTTTKYTDKDI
jgi:hypothetical protein